jgi:GNAT superfamily N-acetyltransferase
MTAGTPSAGAMEGGAEACSARRVAALFNEAGRLHDGIPVSVRPLIAQDRGLLLAGFSALSSRSGHSRFGRGVSDAQFERMLPVLLDTVDQHSHVALLLYAEGRPIGLGRLRRFTSDPGVADLAVTVADDWHGRGAGALLAREVLTHAEDLRELQTVVSQDNPASLRMLARLGDLRSDCVHGSCDVTVRLSRSPAATRPHAA